MEHRCLPDLVPSRELVSLQRRLVCEAQPTALERDPLTDP